ncbi:hypothetical protein QP278_23130 [Escherichia coli]|nr:hypothetical protein [Escherichia coli]
MKSDKELIDQIREAKDYANNMLNKRTSKSGRVLILFLAFITSLMVNIVIYLVSPEFYSNNLWIPTVFAVAIGLFFNVILHSSKE